MKSIKDIAADKCSGCGACQNICHYQAIKMNPDAEGFLYPIVDAQKCIQCGLCYQICPASRPLHVDHETPSFYAFCGEDDVRLKSSSGGAFTYLAEWLLDHVGVVCGAALI